MKTAKNFLLIFVGLWLLACASSMRQAQYFDTVVADLSREDYQLALKKIEEAKKLNLYRQKDRLLYYLDMGITYFYQGDYQRSNQYFEKADLAMEELFTKSISQAGMSFFLNDLTMDYYGEVHENIYVNVFKAINYIKLDQFDDAFVEIRRVDIKLRELEDKYREMVEKYNQADTTAINFTYQSPRFYNDVLAHYLSYLIYRTEGSFDDCRIELEKIDEAFRLQSDVYYFEKPSFLKQPSMERGALYLSVMGFVGQAPRKIAVGGLITTYDNYLGISDLSVPIALPRIPFPGMKAGYHFKFAFPMMVSGKTKIKRVDVAINGQYAGTLELLEDMGKVAVKTFQSKQKIIYLKTLVRTVTKGILAAKGKKKLRKELKADGFLGALLDASVDLAVDATEQPDLRVWKTMPDKCLAGEFKVTPGNHSVDVICYDGGGQVLLRKHFQTEITTKNVNLIHFATLQ
ncbi:hypothetical protein ACX8XP_06920 [Calditrichota bacterium LG25]